MLTMLEQFIRGLFAPEPDPPAPAQPTYVFGYQWAPGAPVPNPLTAFDIDTVGAGLYVGFDIQSLDDSVDPFSRDPGGVGTVYPAPGAPSAAMTALANNPPAGTGPAFANATQQRLADLSEFLAYVNACLAIIDATAAGAQLLAAITAGRYTVFVTPSRAGGNQTTAANPDFANKLVAPIGAYLGASALPSAVVRAAVDATYAAIPGQLGRYNQLAADLTAMPLYSLFVTQPNYQAAFLGANFAFQGNPMTGQNLLDWASPAGLATFDAAIRGHDAAVTGVVVKEFFALALIIALFAGTPPGDGTGAGILFNVRNEGDNVLGSPDFRPPAIGLAHELMHAMHYSAGTSPGAEFGDFSTTAAELLFVGLGPFAGQAISENAVRGQYAGVPAALIDPSNAWLAPVLRDPYEPPGPGETPQDLRDQNRCI